MTLAGLSLRRCFVSTSGTDSDWVVKLIDVYPEDYPDPDPNPTGIHMGGYQQLVRGEAMRGKFRNSFSKPEPFTPGKMEKVEWVMPDIDHVFRRGHRIMVQVQSSWFPLSGPQSPEVRRHLQREAHRFRESHRASLPRLWSEGVCAPLKTSGPRTPKPR